MLARLQQLRHHRHRNHPKKAHFLHRFEASGLPPERIAPLTCPIGVPGIHGKQPEV